MIQERDLSKKEAVEQDHSEYLNLDEYGKYALLLEALFPVVFERIKVAEKYACVSHVQNEKAASEG